MLHQTMTRRTRFLAGTAACALTVMGASAAAGAKPLLTQRINEADTVTMAGNLRPELDAATDLGPVASSYAFPHFLLQLNRSPDVEAAFTARIDAMHDKKSPYFHQWLNSAQILAAYGPDMQDLLTITNWLGSHGITVNALYPNMALDVSATAGQLKSAFGVDIHNVTYNGAAHIANMNNPTVPAALAPVLAGPARVNDFKPHKMFRKPLADYTFTNSNGTFELVTPADLQTIYNLGPAYAEGVTGKGQTIVLIEDSDLYTNGDWYAFRKVLGLSAKYPYGTLSVQNYGGTAGGCTDPGDVFSTDVEVAIDVEWATATAPNANLVIGSCKDTTQFGGFIALQNMLLQANHPDVVSISYGESEPEDGATENLFIYNLYKTAASEGVSVFVSSGDEDAASSDADKTTATHGITVSGWMSTPYNIAVGGTDFEDTYLSLGVGGATPVPISTYWSSTNTPTFGSAKSYIPEIPWNDSCAGALLYMAAGYSSGVGTAGFCSSTIGKTDYDIVGGGSGGPSNCATGAPTVTGVANGTCKGYAKPSWQSLVGVPADGVRDTPDVALFAANGVWGHYYVVCYSNPHDASETGAAPCIDNPSTWAGYGGTSVSSPIMASIQALINEKSGQAWGNANTAYYAIANTEYGAAGNANCNANAPGGPASSCSFYDITAGDMDVNCSELTKSGKTTVDEYFNCYFPIVGGKASGTYGALTTTVANPLSAPSASLVPAYGTGVGWDFSTGIGSVNAANLINNPYW